MARSALRQYALTEGEVTTIAVLVGGPSAGKRFRVKAAESYLRVPRPAPLPVISNECVVPDTAIITQDIYTARPFSFKDRHMIIYCYEKIDDFDAIEELLSHYCPASAYEWR